MLDGADRCQYRYYCTSKPSTEVQILIGARICTVEVALLALLVQRYRCGHLHRTHIHCQEVDECADAWQRVTQLGIARLHTLAYVSIRQPMLGSASQSLALLACIRQHTSESYVSIRQHASSYVSIQKHTSEARPHIYLYLSLSIYLSIYLSLYTNIHTYTYIHTYIYTYVHTHTHTHTQAGIARLEHDE
jgi:hypothetical protein